MKLVATFGIVAVLALCCLLWSPAPTIASSCPLPTCSDCLLQCDAELDFCIDGGWGGDGNSCQWEYEQCEDECLQNCDDC